MMMKPLFSPGLFVQRTKSFLPTNQVEKLKVDLLQT